MKKIIKNSVLLPLALLLLVLLLLVPYFTYAAIIVVFVDNVWGKVIVLVLGLTIIHLIMKRYVWDNTTGHILPKPSIVTWGGRFVVASFPYHDYTCIWGILPDKTCVCTFELIEEGVSMWKSREYEFKTKASEELMFELLKGKYTKAIELKLRSLKGELFMEFEEMKSHKLFEEIKQQ